MTEVLSVKDIADALHWFGPNLSINVGPGHSGPGIYVHCSEYPEDGSVNLGDPDKNTLWLVIAELRRRMGDCLIDKDGNMVKDARAVEFKNHPHIGALAQKIEANQ